MAQSVSSYPVSGTTMNYETDNDAKQSRPLTSVMSRNYCSGDDVRGQQLACQRQDDKLPTNSVQLCTDDDKLKNL